MPTKFTVYKCNNGWLLSVYQGKKVDNEVYTDLMKVLARIADSCGELADTEEEKFAREQIACG